MLESGAVSTAGGPLVCSGLGRARRTVRLARTSADAGRTWSAAIVLPKDPQTDSRQAGGAEHPVEPRRGAGVMLAGSTEHDGWCAHGALLGFVDGGFGVGAAWQNSGPLNTGAFGAIQPTIPCTRRARCRSSVAAVESDHEAWSHDGARQGPMGACAPNERRHRRAPLTDGRFLLVTTRQQRRGGSSWRCRDSNTCVQRWCWKRKDRGGIRRRSDGSSVASPPGGATGSNVVLTSRK